MKKIKRYRYIFSDFTIIVCREMNEEELKFHEDNHGKLLSKEEVDM